MGIFRCLSWYGRIFLEVNCVCGGGCSVYTLQPSALTPVTDKDTNLRVLFVFFFSTENCHVCFVSFFPLSTFLLRIHSNIMIASPLTRLSCGHEISTTAGLSEGITFAKENRGKNSLWKLSEDPSDTLLLPLLLCYKLLNPRQLTLWFIKDLLGESAVTPLTFKVVRCGGGGFEGQEVDKRPLWLFQMTELAGCHRRKCNIICSKLSAFTKW